MALQITCKYFPVNQLQETSEIVQQKKEGRNKLNQLLQESLKQNHFYDHFYAFGPSVPVGSSFKLLAHPGGKVQEDGQ